MKKRIQYFLLLVFLFVQMSPIHASLSGLSSEGDPGFIGMWTLSIEGGGVGWLNIHEDNNFLDAELLWIGGSVVPVSHIYLKDDNHVVVTLTREVVKSTDHAPETRKHIVTNRLEITKIGDQIFGEMTSPDWDGVGENRSSFIGTRLPPVPDAPDLTKVKYGKAINLFNGRDLAGWRLVNPKTQNGFKVVNGVMVNDPVQDDDHSVHYGNLRTEQAFEDFNLKVEVNVPSGNNSGIYLKGMYEIQVFDSYGKELDSHNMGAVYSRIKPLMAAEKPAGQWQSFDITLCNRHITVILNGKKIIDNQPVHGPTGGAIISNVFAPGPIFLQGDHGKVSYRNFVLKPIIK